MNFTQFLREATAKGKTPAEKKKEVYLAQDSQ